VECRLVSLKLEDELEINWKAISDNDWNLWSAHTLQKHWVVLKKSVKGYEDRTFSGMVLRLCLGLLSSHSPPEILKMVMVKKEAELSTKKKSTHNSTSKKKGTRGEDKAEPAQSKAVVEDSDEELAPLAELHHRYD
jgi:hypothetical protein